MLIAARALAAMACATVARTESKMAMRHTKIVVDPRARRVVAQRIRHLRARLAETAIQACASLGPTSYRQYVFLTQTDAEMATRPASTEVAVLQ